MNKINSICLAIALALCVGGSQAAKTSKMSTPTLTCGSSAASYINVVVTAGATGAPAGFTLQWETLADYQTYGWPSSDTTTVPSFCAASLSGVPGASQWNLAPGASVTVQVGDNLFDTLGASTSCPSTSLLCGTTYVFRAFAHANNTLQRSDWSATLNCNTLPCTGGGCTFTQGYWKTHGPGDCLAGNNTNVWPVTSLTLGNVSYTDIQLCAIFGTSGAGNGLISLAHQLIAAKLNVANGADGSAVAQAISDADALIGNLVVPPTNGSTDSLTSAQVSALVTALTNYNEGATGPGHCQ
jgi:hypothetical protein